MMACLTACMSDDVPTDTSYTHVAPEVTGGTAPSDSVTPTPAQKQVTMTLVKADALSMCLTQTTQGIAILAPCDGNVGQQWTVQAGFIINQGICLDVPGPSAQANAAVAMAACNAGRTTQLWSLDTGTLRLPNTTLCVSMNTNTPNMAGTLQTCSSTDPNQQWVGNHTDPNGVTGFSITWAGQPTKCISIGGGQATDGALVETDDCTSASAQLWTWNGSHLLTANGKCYEVNGFDTTNGNQLDVRTCSTGGNTQWVVVGGTISLASVPKCSDEWNGDLTNGNKVALYDCYGAATHQQWVLGKQGNPPP